MNRDITVAVDMGGTFTDVVVTGDEGLFRIAKIPSSRKDPRAVISQIFDSLLPGWGIESTRVCSFIHGTTVATNAVLERRGARLGILTTVGFEDVLEIGRQSRTNLYELVHQPQTPVFLAPGARRIGVVERVNSSGQVEIPLDIGSLSTAVDSLVEQGVDSIAICFLFSFLNDANEVQAARYIAEEYPNIAVSLSSEVDPTFREYERTCVTAFDAYVKPVIDHYLGSMGARLKELGVTNEMQIMQSRGGTCSANIARQRPVRLFLSGPAAGVMGASEVGQSAGFPDIITVDIGGTSSDIALIMNGQPGISAQGYVDGYKIRVPMIDVNAVGAGGGSVAWIDAGGTLKVGPTSAGAEPGPACYGRGGQQPTVTDASVVLGLLDPEYFAGGTLRLDVEKAREAIDANLARPLGMSVEQAALGIHRIANVQMAEGIRLVSISRGIDPRTFALVPFGGAGSLHATALATELDISTIVFPQSPGVLSAAGLMSAPVEHEVSGSYIRDFTSVSAADVRARCSELREACDRLMAAENVNEQTLEVLYFADVCYRGQSHYIEIPIFPDRDDVMARIQNDFFDAYERQFGHQTDAPIRIVNLRNVQRGSGASQVRTVEGSPQTPPHARKTKKRKILSGHTQGFVEADLYDRTDLKPGQVIQGPAIVEQVDTTILIDPGWAAEAAANGLLIARKDTNK
ncbi:Acetophenone carboxylase gamma subunit [Bordetella sputigena]|uniref:hydantoinase/oxoprolinase family protein n=1 Tax=Bordetella sputigena TaxID=1416810 RepID=UPI0039F0E54B